MPLTVSPDFAAFVRSDAFPCVGAKSALALGHMRAFNAGDIESGAHDCVLRAALISFGVAIDFDAPTVASFVCLFESGPVLSEARFEVALWKRLQALHDLDARHGVDWAQDVSSDPAAPDFSMSLGGVAYFVVGLHPGASRQARRFVRPVLVFNPHEQFRRLRADGRYGAMQEIVRDRDRAVSGDINPMLSDFGERGEAAQYSGRRVDAAWKCPFKVRP